MQASEAMVFTLSPGDIREVQTWLENGRDYHIYNGGNAEDSDIIRAVRVNLLSRIVNALDGSRGATITVTR